MNRAVWCAVFVFAVVRPNDLDAGPTLRFATWNVLNGPKNTVANRQAFATVLNTMGLVDVLALVETDTGSAGDTIDLLAELYGRESYKIVISTPDRGGDRTALVYDTRTIGLLDSQNVRDGLTHHATLASLQPLGLVTAESLALYVIHLKSGDAPDIRNSEALLLRQHADQLRAANVLYVGDFNLVGTPEAAWDALTAPGAGQVFDPVETHGRWRRNSQVKRLHTHDSRAGLDDRFDLQLVSSSLLDSQRLEYVHGSYQVIGNDGTHDLGQGIITGTGASPDILSALSLASDHLPVVASYAYDFAAGDANGDYIVDERDIIGVLTAGKYLDRQRAVAWSQGDWDGDRVFNQLDLVAALRSGHYQQGQYLAVPEPSIFVLALSAGIGLFAYRLLRTPHGY